MFPSKRTILPNKASISPVFSAVLSEILKIDQNYLVKLIATWRRKAVVTFGKRIYIYIPTETLIPRRGNSYSR